jgi:hypothetical protein
MRMALRSSTYSVSASFLHIRPRITAYLVVEACPEAVVDVPAPALLDHQPSKAVLQSLYAVVCCHLPAILRVSSASLSKRTWLFARTALPLLLPVRGVLLMALDLRIQAGNDAFQAPQSLEEFGIWRLSALAGCATGSREDAVDFGADTVGTRILLVAFYFATAASNAGPGVWRRPSTGCGAVGAVRPLCAIGRVLTGHSVVGHGVWDNDS